MWAISLKQVSYNFIPIAPHPGGFGAIRKHDIHTGVDIYCDNNDIVSAFEDGIVIDRGIFTGKNAGTPWWNETYYITVQHKNYQVLYGEIISFLQIGEKVAANKVIGNVKQVLKKPAKQAIHNHSLSMLHIEVYNNTSFKVIEPVVWELNSPKPEILIDPAILFK